jgi:spore coat protein SA
MCKVDGGTHIHNFPQHGPILKAICPTTKIALHMNCEWLNQFPRAIACARLKSIDLVICCSDYIRDRVLEVFPEMDGRVHTLYNGVETDRFGSGLTATNGHDIYFIGRISPEKGVHVLIQAFKQVVQEIVEARLFIVGREGALPRSCSQAISDDPIQASAEKFYERSGISIYSEMLQNEVAGLPSGYVSFLGQLSHTDLIERLRSAVLVVQPSLWQEPFGMPVAEAMAMGLPAVVTRGGGLPEIVEDQKTGIIVERGQPEGLAGAIVALLRAPERRRAMGAAARRRAVERFSFRVLVTQLEQQYQSLLGEPHG